MLTIPTDLDSLHPAEITGWLDGVADDDTVTASEWSAAQHAVALALGVPEASPLASGASG
ncbi:hypothetical protein ACEZCY_36115 [Streptacidiphilus sp. N1-12]|uniref:Anti-sigma factor n=1 Tax=Streptacidiphilus alkalitolerans TaxID=3342712 RepID=A0ABV6WRD5_9ACTN